MLTGPVKTPFGYYIFEVQTITPGSQQTLKQAESSIKSQLTATQQQSALSKFVKEFKKKWQGKTDCRAGYMVADCKELQSAQDELHGHAGRGDDPAGDHLDAGNDVHQNQIGSARAVRARRTGAALRAGMGRVA